MKSIKYTYEINALNIIIEFKFVEFNIIVEFNKIIEFYRGKVVAVLDIHILFFFSSLFVSKITLRFQLKCRSDIKRKRIPNEMQE